MTGQILSLLWTGCGVFTVLLDNHTGHEISVTLASGVYVVLSVTCGPYVAFQKDFTKKLKSNWWKFLFLGLVDVESVYIPNLAYKYTSISSNIVRAHTNASIH